MRRTPTVSRRTSRISTTRGRWCTSIGTTTTAVRRPTNRASSAGGSSIGLEGRPRRWLLLDKFESWRYAPQVTAPTLLLAAEYDDIIPSASTRLLYAHLPKLLATLIVVQDAGHNTISDTSEYVGLLRGTP